MRKIMNTENTTNDLEEFPETPINAKAEDVAENQYTEDGAKSINSMYRVPMNVQVVIGQTNMTVAELMTMSRGMVIELDRKVGEQVEVMINDRVVARGDLVDVGSGTVGVNIKEIVKEFVEKTEN
jgi:flagellar motor switch protein FliN/FliY